MDEVQKVLYLRHCVFILPTLAAVSVGTGEIRE